ncbi:MAG: tetratricopeptide repeat protein [Alphaproteobacteria bacterium GM7ARS4]|nr:tetratricopeptide repeat protein [Alphaproteobacteria bacterium GM7ARS4]
MMTWLDADMARADHALPQRAHGATTGATTGVTTYEGHDVYHVAGGGGGGKSFFRIFRRFGSGEDDDADNEDEMVKKYDAAIERDPENAEAYYKRAMFWKGRGRWARAINDFNAALERRSDWADAYYHRSVARMESGYQEEGRADRQKAYDLGYKGKGKKKNKKARNKKREEEE